MRKNMTLFNTFTLLISLGFFFSGNVLASDSPKVAKVIILKGKAKAKAPESEPVNLKKGDWVQEGSLIQTAKKSFVKLLFIDKSQMNLGSNSKMVINKFPRKKAGIITLMKGQLRSKVTKDYLDNEDRDKSKLFIKTKSAAMGVRGTDFEVKHNDKTGVTDLDVVSGLVLISKLEDGLDDLDQDSLEQRVSSNDAVSVGKGNHSSVSPNQQKAAPAVKIPKTKMQQFKQSSDSEVSATGHVPPGIKTSMVKNDKAGKIGIITSSESGVSPTQNSQSKLATEQTRSPASTIGGNQPVDLGLSELEESAAEFEEEVESFEEEADSFEEVGSNIQETLEDINIELPDFDQCGQGQCDPSNTQVNFDFNVE